MAPENAAIPDDPEGSAPPDGATDATPSSSAPADRDEILAKLTQAGRDRVEAQRRAAELEARLAYTGQVVSNQAQELGYIKQQMSKQQWQDFEARLQTMRPEDAANERARVAMEYSRNLEQRLMAAQQRPPVPQQPTSRPPTDDEYSRQYAANELATLNRAHGLAGRNALTVEDMIGVDGAWVNEESFTKKANEMAARRAASKDDSDLSNPKTIAKIREEIKKDLIKDLGAGRSMSPSASPGHEEPANDEVAKIAASHSFRAGPSKSLEALRKNRESILAKMSQ